MTKDQAIPNLWQKLARSERLPLPLRQFVQKHPKPAAALTIGMIVLLIYFVVKSFSVGVTSELAYHTVKRGDFLVSVTEGGSLRAVNEVVIRSEVEGSTRIISIAPEGTSVKKGELLIELDSADIQEKLGQQEITCENQKFTFLQSEQQLAIQKSLGESNIKEAELKVTLAASDLEKYVEGDFPQQTNKMSADIFLAEEELKRAQDRHSWTVQLAKKNYASKSELEADELALKRAEIKISQLREDLRLLLKYDFPKRQALLQANYDSYKDDLIRLKQRTASLTAQSEADLETRKRALELHNQRLQQLKDQLTFTKIYAPEDGLVVYPSFSSSSGYVIEEGSTARQRQELIKLPDTSQMLVEVKIHESFINQIKPGLLAYVTVDSMPDRRFIGSVRRVAPLPDTASRYMNPNLKVYSTEVVIEEPLPDIKPGVSAHAEVVITNLTKVISVPVQAVTTIKGQQYVYLAGKTEPQRVEVGFNNDRFVEIKNGLAETQRILLSPPISGDSEDTGAADLSTAEVEAAKAKIKKSKHREDAKGAVSRSSGKTSSLPPPPTKPDKTKPDKSVPAKTEKPAKPSKSSGTFSGKE